MNKEKIISALDNIKDKTIIVLGDFCLDKYVYFNPELDDISVETGEVAYQIYDRKLVAGAAGTISNNILSLGAKVICVGFAGCDGEGYDMLKCLKNRGADIKYMISTDKLVTPTYLKTMRKNGCEYKEGVRFDFRNKTAPTKELGDMLIDNLLKALPLADGVVISDQFYESDTGCINDYIREKINAIAKSASIPFLVDSRAFVSKYKNVYVKCNNYELVKYFTGGGSPESKNDIIDGIKKLSESTGRSAIVTRNKNDTIVYDGGIYEIETYPVRGEIDVTGAGDASNAGLILGLALDLSPAEAAKIACAISSVTIHILGDTGTATVNQVKELLLTEDI